MRSHRICLIEDEPIMGESLVDRFQLEGFSVDWYRSAEAALEAWVIDRYALVISDVRLPGMSGDQFFSQLTQQVAFVPPFVFITAFATVSSAVSVLKLGAADYVTKPFDIGELVEKARRLVGVVAAPPDEGDASLGPSLAMRSLAGTAQRVAQRARIVLIAGESGAGKEILAQHIHALSFQTTEAPFVAVNCGAIADNLLESEFFGHERGAFTGAERLHRGFFEQANGGTLFLDEIGELPLSMQVKLLRAIQEREIQRLGSEKSVAVDLRLTCATNRKLKTMVAAGQFREDLFYRINVVRLVVPPLRERRSDILWLAHRFLAEQADRLGEPQKSIDAIAQAALINHPWPGNVRELRNRIERACVFAAGVSISMADLFEESGVSKVPLDDSVTLEAFLSEAEKAFIQATLARHEGKVGVTAAVLGVSRKTLWEKTKKFGLRVTDSGERA